jgi:hypothetical protein
MMNSLGFNDQRLGREGFAKANGNTTMKYQNGGMLVVNKEDTYAAAERSKEPPADAAARLHDFMHRPSPIIAWGGEPMPAKAPAEPEITPTWVTLSEKVLRFTGFREESVQESQIETRRVRKIELLYYLEDDTVQVSDDHTRARATATKTTRCLFGWLLVI